VGLVVGLEGADIISVGLNLRVEVADACSVRGNVTSVVAYLFSKVSNYGDVVLNQLAVDLGNVCSVGLDILRVCTDVLDVRADVLLVTMDGSSIVGLLTLESADPVSKA